MPFRRSVFLLLGFLTAGFSSGPASAQDVPVALRGGTVHTAAGPAIPGGTVVFQGGKITAVGAAVRIPPGARIVDVSGMEVIPGMLDDHSHIGFNPDDANERAVPFGPQHRIIDVLSSDDRYWSTAVEGGVTTIVTGPGSGEVSSGQSVVVKTWGPTIEERVVRQHGGLKIAMGGKRNPSTSMGTTALLRQKLVEAREYMDRRRRWEEGGKEGDPPPRDLGMEVVARVLRGQDRIRAHVHAASDILAVLRLKDEFGFDLSLEHATEAYKVMDEIAARDVRVVSVPLFVRIGLSDDVVRAPVELNGRGILVSFHSDDPVVGSKWQRFNGSLAIRYGMSEEDALRGLTINGAKIAWVDDRVGSLEVGKDADVVVTDSPWWELRSRVERVFVNGQLAYQRQDQEVGR